MNIASNIRAALRREPPHATRAAKVWDVPTRLFHWTIVALVLIGWATGEEEGSAFVIHAIAGYALLAALIFRLIWGFVGGAYARFGSFLRSWSVTASYTKQLARLQPQRYIGHNPLGGWMIVLLLVTLAVITLSGLFAQGEEGLAGPWASNAIGWPAEQWYEAHEVAFNFLLLLVVVHVAGVVVDQLLTGDKLVRAMFTGVKQVGVHQEVKATTSVGFGKALIVLAVAVIATGFMVGWQVPSGAGEEEQGERHEERGAAGENERDEGAKHDE